MTFTKLILNSLRFHARSHLGVVLGAAIGTAVLTGALLVGDSVRQSLTGMALQRLGQTDVVLVSNDRLFRTELANELAKELDTEIAPSLIFLATASAQGGDTRANKVQVMGVDERFWKFSPEPTSMPVLKDDEVALNTHLAKQLGVKVGDSVLFRVPKPSQLSREAPMAPEEDTSEALRVEVGAIIEDGHFGRFSLQASQIPANNAFFPLKWFQEEVETGDRCNLLLVRSPEGAIDFLTTAEQTMKQTWKLEDAELYLAPLTNLTDTIELRSGRVFLDAPVMAAVKKTIPESRQALTYFVNSLESGDKTCPYSMVTATEAPLIPEGMKDDEIAINWWLAEKLSAGKGDSLTLRYFVVSDGRNSVEHTNTFRIHSVLPQTPLIADPSLMPDFPGMADAENCSEWDTGFDMDMDLILDDDQAYWDDYKGAPKAFITLPAGQKMWSNRFGSLTSFRFTGNASDTNQIAATLIAGIAPEDVGLVFSPIREQAIAAVNQSQDFGGLFIGFSFFLITAALVLLSMLFQFGVEQRSRETGTLLALGYTPKLVRSMLLKEGLVLSVIGGAIGMTGAIAYAKAMIWGLTSMWQSAVGTSSLAFHMSSTTLAAGTIGGVVIATGTIWMALRKQIALPARVLLAEGAGSELLEQTTPVKSGKMSTMIAWGSIIGAFILTGIGLSQGSLNPGLFFGAGSLFLIGGLTLAASVIRSMDSDSTDAQLSLTKAGFRNAARRRKRSLAVVSMLACGSFMVVAVGANKLDALKNAGERSSGTGGFAFLGETTLSVNHDLSTDRGLDFFGMDQKDMEGVLLVPFRVLEGEEASCLNLNRAQKPMITGVDPEKLASLGAFSFVKTDGEINESNPWLLLNSTFPDGAIPAIGDNNSLMWAMGRKVGQTFDYPDPDHHGNPIKIRIVGGVANSILQGSLIISSENFVKHFPNQEGYQRYLVDVESGRETDAAKALTRGLRDVGLELTSTVDRLDAFNAVQNTYLSTFQALGGLGLLLGSVGIGIVVLRNVLERRSELALLLALGFKRKSIRWMVLSEHGALLILGLATGVVAAVIAVLPALQSPGADIPITSLSVTLLLVLFSGWIWTWLATTTALRGNLIDALRSE
ncbi:FtsX-like permease family protein [Verrucomicrobia bacterium]|nr:FtsX-like permease family protein [Verrucomicrobiota bacterium]